MDSAERGVFVTGIGASTTYPDYKPAPFIVAAKSKGVDMVTVVTEGIFSYCSLKVKIDTDRYLGDERAAVMYQGEEVGHVTTAEYGSQMLSLGGVHHLTGGGKKQGRMALELMHRLGNQQAAEVQVENGAKVLLQAGRAPVVDGVTEQRMRVGCGSAAVGMFARQWLGLCDEVVVVDDHITGVLTEHQAGRCLHMQPSGISIKGASPPRALLSSGRCGYRLGRHQHQRPAVYFGCMETRGSLARFTLADDLNHRRARCLVCIG